MKTKRRRIVNTIIVCALLLSQLIPVAAIAATTEESKSIPVSGTDTTSSTEAPIQSSTSSTFSEQQENKSEINENEVEKNYDERALEENQTNSEHPSVTIEEKKIVDDQLKLKGKIRTPKSATNQSIIEKLVLQSKATDGTWIDKKEFEINSEETLQKNEFDFNFDEATDDSENFRLIVEYEIQYFSNDLLSKIDRHKAHFNIEEIRKEDVESHESTSTSSAEHSINNSKSSESSDSRENATTESNESVKNTEGTHKQELEEKTSSTSENISEKEVDSSSNQLETRQYAELPAQQKKYSQSALPTLSNFNLRASGPPWSVVFNTGNNISAFTANINCSDVKSRSAKVRIASEKTRSVSTESNPTVSTLPNASILYSVNPNFADNLLESGTLGGGAVRGKYTYISEENWNNISSGNKMDLDIVETELATNIFEGTIDNLLPAKKYYVWYFAKIDGYYRLCSFDNLSRIGLYDSSPTGYAGSTSGDTAEGVHNFPFTTAEPVALSKVSKPLFKDPSATSVKLRQGTYTGDISQSNSDGKLDIYKGSNVTGTPTTSKDVWHDTKTSGYYVGTNTNDTQNITGLSAGTKYAAKMRLLKYGGTASTDSHWTKSDPNNFSTKNDPNKPGRPTLNTPTNSDPKATAEFTANYGASKGTDGDHPEATAKNITIEVSDENENPLKILYPTDTSGNGIRLDAAPTVNSNVDNPNINFKLLGLTAKTTYKVRYKVVNSAGESLFSDYQSFTTNGLQLDFTLPTYNQAGATDSSIRMNQGKYTGDISTKKGDILYRPANESENSIVKKTGVVIHETRTGTEDNPGKYGPGDGYELTGLVPGTKYEHWLQLYDNEGNEIEKKGADYFYTANKLNSIPDPTQSVGDTSYSAEASFEVPFEVNTTSTSTVARPKDMKVEVQNSDGSWSEVTSDAPQSVPKLKSKSIGNATTKKMTFTISQLKSNKTYKIGVSAHTENVVWTKTVEKTFTTKAVTLNISSPEVDYRTATPDSIKLKEGTYTGDISDVKGDIANQGGGTSWNRVNGVLEHDTFTGTDNALGKYGTNTNGYTITGLKPGSKGNFAWVYFKDAENIEKNKRTFFPFILPNKLNAPESPVVTQGSTLYSGEASFEVPYEARDISPKELKVSVSSDGGENWIDATENAEAGKPKISPATEGSLGNMSNKRFTFTLSQLRANTNYKIKIQSKNREQVTGQDEVTTDIAEVWSNSVEKDFTTQDLPNGYYLDNVPNFNFGTIDASDQEISAGLNRNNGTSNFNMDILNVGMSAWTLSAKMSEMETNAEEGPDRVLNGARIEFTKKLEKTSDNINWTPVTSGFSGLEGAPNNRVSLTAGSGSIDLFKADEGNELESQGTFRNVIDFESVKLIVPPNVGHQGKTYTGTINWTLDSLP